jgi:hypothetical protein
MNVETVAAAPPHPSPWVSIWFSPRRTIRGIVDSEAAPAWWPVVALTILGTAVFDLQFDSAGALNPSASFMPVVIGAAQIVFGVLVGPFLLAFVGSWFGGEGDPSDIRQGLAWGYLPQAAASLCWIPIAVTSGNALAGDAADVPWLVVIASLIVSAGALWSLVTQVITLAEAQRFSILRAVASLVILLIPVMLLGAL